MQLKTQLKHQNLFISLLIFLLLYPFKCNAAETETPPKVGNFALPVSQQIGPLISFGQNVIDKNAVTYALFADDYAGVNQHFIDVIPSVLYQITDNLSIFVNTPYAASEQSKNNKSTGFEDAFAQLEYAYYSGSTSTYSDQGTIVGNVAAPTGSNKKNPPTGFGSPSFFLGTTFARTYIDWYMFVSPGTILTTAKNGTKFGNIYLYQAGLGRNIANINGWMFAWMVEGNGIYSEKARMQGIIDPNSGGNIVYMTPSIFIATKQLVLQFGIGLPATQHLFGNQPRETSLIAFNIGWTIY